MPHFDNDFWTINHFTDEVETLGNRIVVLQKDGQNMWIKREFEVKWNQKARLYLEKERVKISTADNEEWGPGESDTHGTSWWQECERIAENHLRKEVVKMDGRD